MNIYHKILEILQKDYLTDEDKQLLNSISEKDPEAKEFISTYLKLEKAAGTAGHLSYNDLSDYILFKNGSEPEDKEFVQKVPAIEIHLRNCKKCMTEFETLNSEYSEVESFVAGKLHNPVVKETSQKVNTGLWKKYSFARYSISVVLLIGIIYMGLFAVSSITTSKSYKLASFNDEYEFSTSRGRSTDDFQNSLKELENEKYFKAIGFLNKDIKENKNDETIFYSYYLLGLTYLEVSEKDFLGLFPSYNQNYAEKGLQSLQTSVEKNDSGLYPNITLDAYFYIAKAELMLNNRSNAKKYFKMVIDGKGSKMHEAQNILNDLE